ncbi:MAG: 4-alpha-glucanotransferase [Rhizomicrobium sp.]
MSDDRAVAALATRAGLEIRWTDASGVKRSVASETLKAVLKALELPADTAPDIAESDALLRREASSNPLLKVVRRGEATHLTDCRRAELILANGERRTVRLHRRPRGEAVFRAPREPGYHTLETDKRVIGLAVAPARCLTPRDVAPDRRLAGIAVQIYSLRGGTSGAFGDFRSLGSFAMRAGKLGLDAVMASPTHAGFGADVARYSPYSPSTRLFLDPLFADATLEGGAELRDSNRDALIDWGSAGEKKFTMLRAAFVRFRARRSRLDFEKFCRSGGERLLAHALFESLDRRFRSNGVSGFPNWPADFHSPAASGVAAFAHSAPGEVEFQLFVQWLTDRSAAAAQKAARRTMTIGIVADIAVGTNPEGSHAWSAPRELLRGLHVGAPPDVFNTRGQDWGLTTLSPRALISSGYAPFLATLRSAMRHAGGVRIDHAMGLQRLWVLPAGASPADGVYLRYPQRDLLNLVALESQLRRAIVIGEDLGTVPEGFRQDLAAAGVPGMQVLWFERDRAGGFTAPRKWRRSAAAMTTTHDLPTVAGWWSETDIDWQARTERLRGEETQERAERAADRNRLWSALKRAHCASGDAPLREAPEAAVRSALAFVGKTRCALAIAPAEDIAGDREQPNLPGTIDEHPNWRRRMRRRDLLRDKAARARLKAFLGDSHAT